MNKTIHILMAEDSPSDIRLTQEALKRSGLTFELEIVNDGVEATDHLKDLISSNKTLPDVILLDLNMPRKNGHEVLAEIENWVELKHVPIIVLTVSEREEDVLEALRTRMNYYIAKPVTAEKLKVLLQTIQNLQERFFDKSAPRSNDEVLVRQVLAGNPHTAVAMLRQLADDPHVRVRRGVAENPFTPEDVLSSLAQDTETEVRSSLVENPNIPSPILEMLACDPSEDVRLGLARNKKTPAHLLKALATDDNVYVSAGAQRTLTEVN